MNKDDAVQIMYLYVHGYKTANQLAKQFGIPTKKVYTIIRAIQKPVPGTGINRTRDYINGKINYLKKEANNAKSKGRRSP